MTKSKRIIISALTLIGLAFAIKLSVVYCNANFTIDAKPSMMDCDGVARTSYSLGVSLSL